MSVRLNLFVFGSCFRTLAFILFQIFVSMPVCLYAFLSLCLPVCILSVCMPTCLYACLSVCMANCLYA